MWEEEEMDMRESTLLVFDRIHASHMVPKDAILPYLTQELLNFKVEDLGH
jgi:hypothetical protein